MEDRQNFTYGTSRIVFIGVGGGIGVVMQNMGSENETRFPEAEKIDIAHSILSRDFKGIGNWNANGVIEIWKLKK